MYYYETYVSTIKYNLKSKNVHMKNCQFSISLLDCPKDQKISVYYKSIVL